MTYDTFGPIYMQDSEVISVPDGEVWYAAANVYNETEAIQLYDGDTSDTSNRYGDVQSIGTTSYYYQHPQNFYPIVGPCNILFNNGRGIIYGYKNPTSFDPFQQFLDDNSSDYPNSVVIPDGEVWHVAVYLTGEDEFSIFNDSDGTRYCGMAGTAQTDNGGNSLVHTFIGDGNFRIELWSSRGVVMGWKEHV